MAIKLQLADASVTIGGSFDKAKNLAKSLAQRPNPFDGATKTWQAPHHTLKEFHALCSLPYDVLDGRRAGEHVTRYGTRYDADEWAAKREIADLRPPDELIGQVTAAEDAAEAAFDGALTALGWDTATVITFRARLQRYQDLQTMEECGAIVFSSDNKRTTLDAIIDAYYGAMLKASTPVDDWLEIEQRRIDEKYEFQ